MWADASAGLSWPHVLAQPLRGCSTLCTCSSCLIYQSNIPAQICSQTSREKCLHPATDEIVCPRVGEMWPDSLKENINMTQSAKVTVSFAGVGTHFILFSFKDHCGEEDHKKSERSCDCCPVNSSNQRRFFLCSWNRGDGWVRLLISMSGGITSPRHHPAHSICHRLFIAPLDTAGSSENPLH